MIEIPLIRWKSINKQIDLMVMDCKTKYFSLKIKKMLEGVSSEGEARMKLFTEKRM